MKQRILIAFLLSCVSVAGAQVYTITDLGPLSPTAINSWAQVVGNYNNEAYIWTFGHRISLGVLPGGTFSQATGINDLVMVTGTADGPGIAFSPPPGSPHPGASGPNQQCSYLIQPFLWTSRNGIAGLGIIGAADDEYQTPAEWCLAPFYGAGINDLGEITGYTGFLGDEFQWGFNWTNSKGYVTLFGGSWTPTFAMAINNRGEIVGQNSDGFDQPYATAWQNNVPTELGVLPAEYQLASSAVSVNDVGQIVGWAAVPPSSSESCFQDLPECLIHAVSWTKAGTISDLGTLPGDTVSSAVKVNLFGLVVGNSGSSVVASGGPGDPYFEGPLKVVGRPFIWSQGKGMRDLNTLIPASSGWALNSAADINVWGQIVGSGTLNGQTHGYLLTPKAF